MRLWVVKVVLIIGLISCSISIGLSEEQGITGMLIKYTGNSIIVDGKKYSLCPAVKVFNMEGERIDRNDLKGADKVKIIFKGGCISEVRVMGLRH